MTLTPASVLSDPDVLPLDVLTGLVRDVAADHSGWQSRLRIPPPGSERWWTRLMAGRSADVWLLSWLPGHTTELHDHGTSAASFTVVGGRLRELRVGPEGSLTRHVRRPGEIVWVAPGVRHDVTGAGAVPAVSIHAYSPPLREMSYYDRAGRLLRTVSGREPEHEARS